MATQKSSLTGLYADVDFYNDEGIPCWDTAPSIGGAVPAGEFLPGQLLFGRYRLKVVDGREDAILGRGGSGVVYLAEDERLTGKEIALKIPSPELRGEDDALNQVLWETRHALSLTHPNIVRIFDFHEDGNLWAISMQHIRGRDLAQHRAVLARKKRVRRLAFSVEEIREWIEQLCDALTYAHEQAGRAHRDLKPKNLMIEDVTANRQHRERLLVTDFGLAAVLQSAMTTVAPSLARESAQDGAGTLPYMSPQQLRGKPGEESDDIYSLGATIYDLLAGGPPFSGAVDSIKHQIENVEAVSIEECRRAFGLEIDEAIPEAWESVVHRCLAKDKADRPHSVREIAEELGLGPRAGSRTKVAELEAQVSRVEGDRDLRLKEAEEEFGRVLAEREAKIKELGAAHDEVRESVEQKGVEIRHLADDREGLRREIERLEAEKSVLVDGDGEIGALIGGHERFVAELNATHAKKVEELEQLRQEEIAERVSAGEAELAKLKEEREAEGLAWESRIKAIQDEAAASKKQTAQKLERSLEKLNQARDAEQTRMEGKVKELTEQAQVLRQEREQAASQLAEARGEESRLSSQVADLKQRHRSGPSLMPVAVMLLVAMVVGIAGGFVWSLMGPTGHASAYIETILEQPNSSPVTVKVGVFRQFLDSRSKRDEAIEKRIKDLSDDDPLPGGVSFYVAAEFCEWLTIVAKGEGSGLAGDFRLPTSVELESLPQGTGSKEWCWDGPDGSVFERYIFVPGETPNVEPMRRTAELDDTIFRVVVPGQ